MENLMCSQDIQLHLNEFTGHTNVIDSVKDNTDTKSQSVMGALCDGWQAVIYRDCSVHTVSNFLLWSADSQIMNTNMQQSQAGANM